MLGFDGCKWDEDIPGDDTTPIKYSREYWGEWLRMDTGDTWYISGNDIIINGSPSSSSFSMNKQSERVIEINDSGRKYYLFGSRIANANFTGKIAGFQQPLKSGMLRAVGEGREGARVGIANRKNPANTTSAISGDDGSFTADGIIPGDEYTVTPEGGPPLIITPVADGDDIGTITLTGGVNFKTSIRPRDASLDMTMMYAGSEWVYDFDLVVENTGTEDCYAGGYALGWDDGLTVTSTKPVTGIFGTIEPGRTVTLPIAVSCAPLETDRVFKKISIAITDAETVHTWEDSVSLPFNKKWIDFKIRSEGSVSGVIITPEGKAFCFTNTTGISCGLPWSTKDYLLVFSGATVETETVYSFAVNAVPDTNYDSFTTPQRYEPNGTEDSAADVDGAVSHMAYLHKNDIDFFKVNLNSSIPPTTSTVPTVEWPLDGVPGTPTVTAGDAQLTVTWTAFTGASEYEVYYGTTTTPVTLWATVSATSVTITGLSNSTTYYVGIKAKNNIGTSDFSLATIGTPFLDVPGTPVITTGDAKLTVTWTASAGTDEYEVYYGTTSTPDTLWDTISTTSTTITGLVNGTTYYVRIRAKGVGTSDFSPVVNGTPFLAAPGTPIVTAGDANLTITWAEIENAETYEIWTETSNNSSNAVKYGEDITGTATTITGLTNGTIYYVWIKAKSSTGTSVFSPVASGTPFLAAPEILTVTAGHEQLTVTWAASAGANEYEVYYGTTTTPNTIWTTVSVTSTIITGLTNGTTYYVRIRAKGTGTSDFSPIVSSTLTKTVLYKGAISPANKIGTVDITFACNYISSNANTGDQYYIVLGENQSMDPVTFSYSGKTVGITLMSDGTNRTLQLASSGSLFTVGSGVTLTIEDNVTLKGRIENTVSLVYINNNAMFIMHGGNIYGNRASAGGGVYVDSGTFTMSGGSIYGNTSSVSGYGLFSKGGGVYVDSGTFTMSGGSISGNDSSSDSGSSCGGGVYVESGTFTMSGGAISSNTTDSSGFLWYYGSFGGGVYVESSTFTMSGGEISNNIAFASVVNTTASGGGVFVRSGTFTMLSGEISRNNTIAFGYSDGSGVSSNGTFAMSGGKISSNIATSTSYESYGGGVYVGYHTFTMTGGEISGNTSDAGGGVMVSVDGIFTKSSAGGVIYGNNASPAALKNSASGNGDAVYVPDPKVRNTTAGIGIALDSTKTGAAGGWE